MKQNQVHRVTEFQFYTYGIFKKFNKKFDAPPCVITVTITINDVVVSIACRASDTVFLIAVIKHVTKKNYHLAHLNKAIKCKKFIYTINIPFHFVLL